MAPTHQLPPSVDGSSVDEHQVVCILKAEHEKSGYIILRLEEPDEDKIVAYKLLSIVEDEVPPSWLDKYMISQTPAHLRSSSSRDVHVLVSTKAGTGLALGFYQSVLEPLMSLLKLTAVDGNDQFVRETRSLVYNLVKTKDEKSISTFAHSLRDSLRSTASSYPKEHTVILLSGDGGAVDMLNGIARASETTEESSSSTPLVSIMPLGTGNALFNSLHKPVYKSHDPSPSPLVVALRALVKGRPASLPCFKATFSSGSRIITYGGKGEQEIGSSSSNLEEQSSAVSQLFGAIVASYGFHSQLVWESDTPEYRKHGSKRFGMVAEELLKKSHAYNAEVKVQTSSGGGESGAIDRSTHAYILATMVSNLERTFTISPASTPLDGKLRLVHFGAVGGEKTMEIMMQAYNEGSHVGMKWAGENGEEQSVGYKEIQQVDVTTLEDDARWRKVCVDGTIVELPKGGSMTVRTESKSYMNVLVDRSVGEQ